MTDLTPITALGGAAPRREDFGPLTLAERPDLGLAALAVRAGAGGVRPAPLGLDLPGPGGLVLRDDLWAFWTGPEQWMIAGERRAEEDFAAAVRRAAPGASVTEQTDGWAAVEIASAGGAEPLLRLIEKLANLDPARLAPGCAVRTGLHRMGVFVLRPSGDRLTLLGMRSAAGTLWQALETAARRNAAK
ncbi:sarcosine oxidase subunit gamma [Rhodovulum sp. ES.010]|uniref:sarcosine oxidase subunit gamma n=1 Tax=Rhodovulum sp. ES.010 TaxID=1882821 RepID=UPI000928B491|nr:sarcosine oxidase subunit gamma [Rhodovulum sp. ES.010]SIO30248.1 sarcosine oxidase subunit gamma [Rhodovulum sp. ES.010]